MPPPRRAQRQLRPSYSVRDVSQQTLWLILAISLTAVLIGGFVLYRQAKTPQGELVRRRLLRRPHRDSFRVHPPELPALKRAAVVVNPTKFDNLASVEQLLTEVCREHGWDTPVFLRTTPEDPGTGQARQAAAEGADVVCALGGDGTVRAVAKGLLEHSTPMGLLPAGTGNLLARNLAIPVISLEQAMVVALTGRNQAVDVGCVTLDRTGDESATEDDHFLVMSGLGADSAVMSDADDRLKRQIGTGAYVVAGLRNMYGTQFKARISVDGAMEFTRRSRSILIGNCGRLFGGLDLMPDARVDDGRLDMVILSPKGVVGWAAVAASAATRQRKGHALMDRHTGERLRIRVDRPEEVQLDGDLMGTVRAVTAWVRPRALAIRVPM